MVRRYLLMTVAIASLCTACADDGTSLRIECPVPPDEECFFDPGADECILQGRLNLAEATQYSLLLRVANGLTSRAAEVPLRPETNSMDVTSAEVALTSTSGDLLAFNGLPNPFSVTTTGRVPIDGEGIANIQAIPPDYVATMRDNGFEAVEGTIVIRVTLNARTDGDVLVTSRNWRWPVDLLSVEGSVDACIPSDELQVSCLPGQDGEVLPYCSNL